MESGKYVQIDKRAMPKVEIGQQPGVPPRPHFTLQLFFLFPRIKFINNACRDPRTKLYVCVTGLRERGGEGGCFSKYEDKNYYQGPEIKDFFTYGWFCFGRFARSCGFDTNRAAPPTSGCSNKLTKSVKNI